MASCINVRNCIAVANPHESVCRGGAPKNRLKSAAATAKPKATLRPRERGLVFRVAAHLPIALPQRESALHAAKPLANFRKALAQRINAPAEVVLHGVDALP